MSVRALTSVFDELQNCIDLCDAYCKFLLRKRKVAKEDLFFEKKKSCKGGSYFLRKRKAAKEDPFLENRIEKEANEHVCKVRVKAIIKRHLNTVNTLLEESSTYSPININENIKEIDRRRTHEI